MALTQAQFKARFAELGEYTKAETNDIFEVLTELVKEVVSKADRAVVPGIGTINCAVREKRKARNPATGESVQVPAKIGVRLSLAKSVKDAVPSVKKGRALVEARLAEKQTRSQSRTKAAKKATKAVGKRKPGRPKGSGAKKSKV
jgi:DNA-binding protein HU-beta